MALALTFAAGPAQAMWQQPATGLCRMDTTRGAVPASFALDACVDGAAVWLRNQLSVPVRLAVSGDTGSAVNVPSDTGLAATATRAVYPAALAVLPGDTVRVPIGKGAAAVTVASTDAGGFYLIAATIATFIPLGRVKEFYEAFTGLVKDVASAYSDYRNCMTSTNWIGQLGCRTKLAGAVTFAFGKAVVLGLAKAALATVLNTAFYLQFVKAQVPDIAALLGSSRTISIAARGSAPSAQPPGPPTQPAPVPAPQTTTPPVTAGPPAPVPQVVTGLHYDCANDNSNIGKYVPAGKYWQNDFVANGSRITGGFVLIGAADDGGNHSARVGIYAGPGIGSPMSTVVVPVRGYGGQSFALPNPLTVTPGQRLYLSVVGVGDFTAYDNRGGCFIGRLDGLR